MSTIPQFEMNPDDYEHQADVVDGYHTGLWCPKSRPDYFPSVSNEIKIMDTVTANRLIASPERTPARERFPAEKWMMNQGRRSSCTGFATAGILSRARVMSGLEFLLLSGEWIYSLINSGRDAGSPLEWAWKKIQEVGAARRSLVEPQSFLYRSMSAEARADAANHKGFECFRIDTEMEMVSAILMNMLVVACVHVGGGYRSLDKRGVRGASRGRGNHAIGLQDVRLSPEGRYEFDEVGSWGRGNGQDGYAWLTWDGHFDSTVERHAFYAIPCVSGNWKQVAKGAK